MSGTTYSVGELRGPFMWLVCPERSTHTVRILITVSPLMYREALALSIHKHRPLHEVRIASPEVAEEEVGRFEPHLLIRTDNDGLNPEVLEGVASWMEVIYTDNMATRIVLDGRIDEVPDACTDDLLAAVDETEGLISADGG
jgi:hypothetical protein